MMSWVYGLSPRIFGLTHVFSSMCLGCTLLPSSTTSPALFAEAQHNSTEETSTGKIVVQPLDLILILAASRRPLFSSLLPKYFYETVCFLFFPETLGFHAKHWFMSQINEQP